MGGSCCNLQQSHATRLVDMNMNDFRYMRQGKLLDDLCAEDLPLLQPIKQEGPSHDRALLLLHGFTSSPAVYRYLLPQLTNYDAIICPVLPGHADSIDAFSRAKAADWLQVTHDICDDLVKRYHKVDVLGLSLGGLLACELSKKFPINHLFLLAPALFLRLPIVPLLALIHCVQPLGFTHVRNAAGNLLNAQHAEISYRKLPLTTAVELLTLVKNYQWSAPHCPVDLFLGSADKVVCSKKVAQLFDDLPNAQIHWLKNSAHVLTLDNDLGEIVACIRSAAP